MEHMNHEEIDANTSATVRAADKKPDGSGHTVIKIEGMTCQHCVDTVAQAIFDVPGVVAVKVFLAEAKAMYDVEYPVDSAVVAESVAKAGYKVVA